MPILDFLKPKITDCLGIDVGTNILKIVELGKEKGRLKLKNYALASPQLKGGGAGFKTSALSVKDLSALIKDILKKAQFKSRRAIISLPILSSFSVLMEMPLMQEKELNAAIPFEAKKYIPVPINEVVLDWSLIQTNKDKIRVLVVAVPNEVIDKYSEVGRLANLNILNFEQEAFSLSRILVGNDPKSYLVIDIGSRGSSVIIIDNGFVMMSHALEAVDISSVCDDIKKVVEIYKMKYNKDIKNCILTGGKSIIGNSLLIQKISECLNGAEVIIGSPFARIDYAPQLSEVFKNIGPSLAVAAGLAMREL